MYDVIHDPRFWVSVIAAFATLSAVTVALFGRELRAYFRPPKLEMSIPKEHGRRITVRVYDPSAPTSNRDEFARYYHVRVTNPRRKADSVNQVALTLLRVETKGKDGDYHETWSGDIPMVWRNERLDQPPEKKTIGTWADADLCHVLKNKWLELPVRVVPTDLLARYRLNQNTPVDIAVTVQARGNEADSLPLRLCIFWDGEWEDGDREMLKHFSVTSLEFTD